ncbi:hypothetical protein KY290_002093 [Solanum tuberosum]|uniref:Uncharacterized protein n=1 Tax=Solanum tuberosum TaxID=4113 RepID=A0ABQ7WPK7_SOLTU|nr:hypothetical protein KY284_002132 [Solanum tuberosum]KAH0731063.1 hypothetical protein KY289_002251 [Solanum tuberosum]KAH0782495.1 hypothetical protein KY290_002093 [Solanum tuberosum]
MSEEYIMEKLPNYTSCFRASNANQSAAILPSLFSMSMLTKALPIPLNKIPASLDNPGNHSLMCQSLAHPGPRRPAQLERPSLI